MVSSYGGRKIVETRNGSGTVVQQFIHGTRYIDELVTARVAGKGEFCIYQDANWNAVGVTDLGGNVVERNVLTPYGQLTVDQETGAGDYDGDGDVDSTDRAAAEVGGACRGSSQSGACRILDLDFDGDVDDDDLTLFDALLQGNMEHPGLAATAIDQPYAHQGLLFEPEIGSYQNRARQHDPGKRRFAQRDPLLISAYAGTGSQDGLNVYAVSSENPVAYRDPMGTSSLNIQGRPCLPFATWPEIGIGWDWGWTGPDGEQVVVDDIDFVWIDGQLWKVPNLSTLYVGTDPVTGEVHVNCSSFFQPWIYCWFGNGPCEPVPPGGGNPPPSMGPPPPPPGC